MLISNTAFLAVVASTAAASPTILQARNPYSPPVPEGIVEGHLSCVEPNTGRAYKVAAKVNDKGVMAHTDGDDLAVVKVDLRAAIDAPVSIEYESTSWLWGLFHTGRRYVGAIATAHPALGKSDSNYAYLGATDLTDAGSPPAQGVDNSVNGEPATWVESVIWRYDPSCSRLKPEWRNMDGSTVEPLVFYNPTINGLSVTGDIAAFESLYGQVNECYLKFQQL